MSFNRNLKRVAGPGFHVNVRYDDVQVHSLQHSSDGNSSPYLTKGRRLKEIWDVKEQEILVAMDKDSSSAYFDGFTHCLSVCNGWQLDQPQSGKGPLTVDDIKEQILSQVRFVGVATTDFSPTGSYLEQGFVAQVGGVTTLLNESSVNIYPGDKVMLDVTLDWNRNVTRDKGIPREKVRFTVRPAMTTDQVIAEAAKNAGQLATQIPGSLDSEIRNALDKVKDALALATVNTRGTATQKNDANSQSLTDINKILTQAETTLNKTSTQVASINSSASSGSSLACTDNKAFLRELAKLNRRVIGKAFSFARPGDRLEVCLQPRSEF